jgi:hypothetical protein
VSGTDLEAHSMARKIGHRLMARIQITSPHREPRRRADGNTIVDRHGWPLYPESRLREAKTEEQRTQVATLSTLPDAVDPADLRDHLLDRHMQDREKA